MKLLKAFCILAVIATLQSHAASTSAVLKPAVNPTTTTFLGYWVGMFKPDNDIVGISAGEHDAWDFENKITISIDEISNDQVKGHSVVAGNYRPFIGKMINEGKSFHFLVKEPGDDKYDGIFDFYITGNLLTGTWKANNKIRIPKRNYSLEKKIFRYNPDIRLTESNQYVNWVKNKKVSPNDPHYRSDYDISYFTTTRDLYKYNASVSILTKEQVSNLKKADLFILRNSIYARHGYSFKNQQLRAYFDREPWYIPVSTDVKNAFTAIEKKNIEILMRYEKNAKEYYDVFGRG